MDLVDRNLFRIVLDNLIGNAWKFTGKVERPQIAFGTDAGVTAAEADDSALLPTAFVA